MLYCGVDREEAQRGANIFRDFYKSEALFEATLYEGIISLLAMIKEKGLKIGVATYKREDYAIDLLRKFGIADYCDVIHGADNDNKYSKKDIIEMCINELGEDRTGIVMIGDTEHDAQGAYDASISFIAVTWGFGYKEDSFKSTYPNLNVASTPAVIASFLEL
jgi:phosphoglycolate phosphatase